MQFIFGANLTNVLHGIKFDTKCYRSFLVVAFLPWIEHGKHIYLEPKIDRAKCPENKLPQGSTI